MARPARMRRSGAERFTVQMTLDELDAVIESLLYTARDASANYGDFLESLANYLDGQARYLERRGGGSL